MYELLPLNVLNIMVYIYIMADDTCIINDTSNNDPYTCLEHYYAEVSDFTPYTRLLFIDSLLETTDDKFSQYINDNTFALVYKYNTDRGSIVEFLNNFTNITRIGFAFHGPSLYNVYKDTHFIHSELLYTLDDISENQTIFSDNVLFIKDVMQLYSSSLQYIDFLACNTLLYDKWKKYFSLLQRFNNTITIGASSDDTGNIKFGGDWIMESTSENIESIYFTQNIQYYKYLLDYSITSLLSINRHGNSQTAIKSDGSVIAWGNKSTGGSITEAPSYMERSQRQNIVKIWTNGDGSGSAHLALKADGSIIGWGNSNYSTTVPDGLDSPGPIEDNKVIAVYFTVYSWAVIKGDGSVVSWSQINPAFTSSKSALLGPGSGVVSIIPSGASGFIALKSDGSRVSWGTTEPPTSVTAVGNNYTKLYEGGSGAFAALNTDGTVITWGNNSNGGNSSAVQSQLTNIVSIRSTRFAFAALKADGTVVT